MGWPRRRIPAPTGASRTYPTQGASQARGGPSPLRVLGYGIIRPGTAANAIADGPVFFAKGTLVFSYRPGQVAKRSESERFFVEHPPSSCRENDAFASRPRWSAAEMTHCVTPRWSGSFESDLDAHSRSSRTFNNTRILMYNVKSECQNAAPSGNKRGARDQLAALLMATRAISVGRTAPPLPGRGRFAPTHFAWKNPVRPGFLPRSSRPPKGDGHPKSGRSLLGEWRSGNTAPLLVPTFTSQVSAEHTYGQQQ